jgi:hypothetical protein
MRTRRDALAAGAGLALAGALGTPRALGRAAALPAPPRGLPAAQHAWEEGLREPGAALLAPPRFHRLLLLGLRRPPGPADALRLERVLRDLERAFAWDRDGLLFAVGWGPAYFARLGAPSPVEPARPLAAGEAPVLDGADLCVHLASDREGRLVRVEALLRRRLRGLVALQGRRVGFTGAGVPRARWRRHRLRASAPLLLGHRSGLRANQATEAAVTIAEGPFAGGTTMHVSRIALDLERWYGELDERERVARMYGAHVTPREARRLIRDTPPGRGAAGHAQAVRRARRDGRPLLLRRDFSGVSGGEPVTHFVALQRATEDFAATRARMDGARGIAPFLTVTDRANFVLPPRTLRAFPLLEGREHALGAGR